MASITPTYPSSEGTPGVKIVRWALANADDGVGVVTAPFADKTVTITGTFGGATVVVQGSNDSTDGTDGTWITLVDPQGTGISKTSAAIEAILENPLWIRATSSGGSGSAIVVILVGRQ